MKYNTPYGQTDANIEGLKITISKVGGTGYEIFTPEEIKEHEDILHTTILEMKKNEEMVIKQVLKQLLKRDLTLEDFKKVTRVFICNVTEKYTLAYDGEPLGTIKYHNCPEYHYSVKFYPNEKFNSF
jgi:hypothetical protein